MYKSSLVTQTPRDYFVVSGWVHGAKNWEQGKAFT